MNFTAAQQQAIERNGNLIVSAAAGAGKTSVLSERVFRLVREGMSVEHMLILTFTRAAAGEMKARITKRLLGAAAEEPARAAYYREQAAAVAEDLYRKEASAVLTSVPSSTSIWQSSPLWDKNPKTVFSTEFRPAPW
mgnify:CR=1 FL=1